MRPTGSIVHYGPLDGLRGLAAQLVFAAHAFCFAYPERLGYPVGNLRSWLARLAVIAFFALSGFVIAMSITRHAAKTGRFDAGDYAIRRAARILPPYLAILVILLAVAIADHSGLRLQSYDGAVAAYDASPGGWLRAVLFLNRGQDAISILDTPLWSLRIEVGLYILAALAAFAWYVNGTARRGIVAVAFAVLLALLWWRLAYAGPAALVFAAGGAVAITLDRALRIMRLKLWFWAAMLLAAAPLAFPALVANFDDALSFVHQCVFGVLFAIGLAGVATQAPSPSWHARLVRASGDWSYTLYILHWPALLVLNSLTLWRGWPALAVYFVLINAASYALSRLTERPALFAEIFRAWLSRPLESLQPDREPT